MNSKARTLPLLSGLLLSLPACVDSEAEATSTREASGPIVDRRLAAWQTELIDLAFCGVSKFPLDPHIKDRARAQEKVVAACFALSQPQRALGYIEKIPNWRRGKGHADYAAYYVEHGHLGGVEAHLAIARQVASEMARNANSQAWRRDRIVAAIARVRVFLGQKREAKNILASLTDSAKGRIDSASASLDDARTFDVCVETLDEAFVTGNFDQIQGALHTCVSFFGRFYGDEKRRTAMEKRVKTADSRLPINVRVELLMGLVGCALERGDKNHALDLVDYTQRVSRKGIWLPERDIQIEARLASLRYRSGDKAKARRDVESALAHFRKKRIDIVDIYRSGSLRAVAESYCTMGDRKTALAIYKRAVEAGMLNPNARPRAEDFAATCCSMALQRCEPDAALRARLAEIGDGLGDPW